MPKSPNRPKIKYKYVKPPPPPKKTPEEFAAQKIARLEALHKINPQVVSQLILRERGLITQVCRALKISRSTLVRYIEQHDECVAALTHAREAMGDKAESKLFEKIEEGDLRAILYYLSTVHGQTRGYRISGTPADANGASRGPVYVETVNIVGVPSGTFLPKEIASQDNMVVENNTN